MKFSTELLEQYKSVYEKVGPLRYQMADADCVPSTVVNALLYASKGPLPTTLMRLIWSASLDNNTGTGWVGCKLLADVLQAWFSMAQYDKVKRPLSDLHSLALQDEEVSLGRNNKLVSTLNDGGVLCITVDNGKHYSLLHSHSGGKEFYGFDPSWISKPKKREKALELTQQTFGMCNMIWTREELLGELDNVDNQFVHVIRPAAS